MLVFRDVSERRRQEAALRKTEEQLRHAQKIEVLGRLAGGVAHNINNLMTVVTAYAELVFNELPSESPLRRMVKAIKEAGDSASLITRQLLAFSRKQVLMPVVVSLNHVVTAMEEVLRSLIGEDVEVSCHLEPDLGRVKVDRNEIELAIMNLAVNARDAMPQGGKLTLETRNVFLDEPDARGVFEGQPGRYVMLAVTDTGCGMDAHIKARLFQPFYHEGNRQRHRPGAGNCLWHRQTVRRSHLRKQRVRRGSDVQNLPSGSHGHCLAPRHSRTDRTAQWH